MKTMNVGTVEPPSSSAFLVPTNDYIHIYFSLVCYVLYLGRLINSKLRTYFTVPSISLFFRPFWFSHSFWVVTLIRNHSFFSSNQVLCHRWLIDDIQLMLICLPAIKISEVVQCMFTMYIGMVVKCGQVVCCRLFLRIIYFTLHAHRIPILIWNSTSFSICSSTSHT